jgi:hypothetical protein
MAIDDRAYSDDRIAPPAPLPHVSRKALKRVKDPLPAPEVCRYCGGAVELVSNGAIYRREYGEWPYAYLCRPCDAYVGLHPQTDIPLGTLANAELRDVRKNSKALFHKLMELRGWSRNRAYARLAEALNMPAAECHFGHFDADGCNAASVYAHAELCKS